jgi:2-dehydropantoate 2-reductase
MSAPRIAIVGTGAIGGLLAKSCEEHQLPYSVVTRDNQSSALKVTNLDNHTLHLQLTSTKDTEFDLLLLPVKAYQVEQALKELKERILPRHTLVLLHNGMGGIESAKKHYPNNPIVAGITSYGALKSGPNHITETGSGDSHFGWVSKQQINEQGQAEIEHTLNKLLPPCTWHQDITLALWNKLVINCVINPITAIYDVKNGDLAHTVYRQKITQVCEELAKVMTAVDYPTSANHLRQNVEHVISNTAANYSSMHQDIKHSRPTEIQHINGYVVELANKLKIDTPVNQQLYQAVLYLEQKSPLFNRK